MHQESQKIDSNRPKRFSERNDIDPTVRKAAEGLESLFMDTMFRTMRGTVQKSELSLDNGATEIYRGMLDSEVAKTSARNNSIGLADQIVAYLESRGYTNKSRTGGTTNENSVIHSNKYQSSQNRINHSNFTNQQGREVETNERVGEKREISND